MRKKTSKKIKEQPLLPWQVEEYARRQELAFVIPYPVLHLCKLLDITPRGLLHDFLDNLAHASWKREGRDAAKGHLVEYVLAHGYGQGYYGQDDIRQMFREMDAMGMLFPKEGDAEFMELHNRWREGQYTYFYDKWWGKLRRR